MYDAIVIGGSFAGLSAALQLARARRHVLVIDGGQRRNRFVSHSHGFITQDGQSPGEIVARARAQLVAYPSVTWMEGRVETARRTEDGRFAVKTTTSELEALALVLAIGVTDSLPDIPGLQKRWGKSIFICPYCDGYELGDGPIGVLNVSPMSIHHALMLPDWGRTIFFLNGRADPTDEEMRHLHRRGVALERAPITLIDGERADVHLADGRVVPVAGAFTTTRTTLSSDIAHQLGCEIEESPSGVFLRTDFRKATTIPGVFACGDAARSFGSVAMAVGDGNLAGSTAHQWTILRKMGQPHE